MPNVQVVSNPGLTDNMETQIDEETKLDDPLLHELAYPWLFLIRILFLHS